MSTANLLRLPKVPRFDPDSGENPYQWIVKTAPKVRDQQQAAHVNHMQGRRLEHLLYIRPVKP